MLMKKIKQGNLLESTQEPPFRRVVRGDLSEKATFEQRAKWGEQLLMFEVWCIET